ncbi:TfoX/Sxy family protein, partial [Acinetobacter baumannii]
AERVRALLHGPVVERRMMGGLCFMAGDHMACGVVGAALMVRVGKDAMPYEPQVRPLEFGGRRTAGFILVDPTGVRT